MIVEPSRDDVGVTPHAETGTSSPTPLIGRDAELHALLLLLEPGGTAVVNVTGARGGGKSALVRAALEGLSAPRSVDIQRLDVSGETMASAMMWLRRHVSRAPIPLRRGDSRWEGERMLLHLERADVLARAGEELTRHCCHSAVSSPRYRIEPSGSWASICRVLWASNADRQIRGLASL